MKRTFLFGAATLFLACGGSSGSSDGAGGAAGSAGAAGAPASSLTLSVTGLEVNQAVRRMVIQDRSPVDTGVPLVSGRDALVRVYYSTSAGEGESVAAQLTLGSNSPISSDHTLGAASDVAQLGSTLNFDVPGSQIAEGANDYSIRVTDSSGEEVARWPESGTAQLQVDARGGVMTLVLVPVRYDFDGSGRTPTFDDATRQQFRDILFGLLPVTEVEVQVADPLAFGDELMPTGAGWSELVDLVGNERTTSSSPATSFHMGVVQPSDELSTWCSAGCVTGLGPEVMPGMADLQAGLQVFYSGGQSGEIDTFVVGILHGLARAPCGVFGGSPDPAFPHMGGGIGEFGYDLTTGELKDPAAYTDFMGDCPNEWVSGYHYQKLVERWQLLLGT